MEAAAKEGAAKAGRKVAATELPSVDLVVCGSVAVNHEGARIGKGGGFSDLEVAFLVEAGVIRPDTVLATTVHPLQVVRLGAQGSRRAATDRRGDRHDRWRSVVDRG